MEEHGNAHDFSQNTSLATHLSHDGLLSSHIYIGSFFFVLSTWWLIAGLRAQHHQGKRFQAALTYNGKCGKCSAKLIEGLVKLCACIVGLIIEAITVKALGRPENYTYTTIYASFILAAVVDIFSGLRVVLPDGIDFLAHAVAFANLGVLARSQAWGHLHLTVATRLLTSYIAIFASISLILELYKPQSQVLKFIRTGAVMLQGVWFWQSGIVLDSPLAGRWMEKEHFNLMFITIAFAWDMFGVIILQILLAITMAKMFGGIDSEASRRHFRHKGLVEPVNTEAGDDYKPLNTSEVETSGDPH